MAIAYLLTTLKTVLRLSFGTMEDAKELQRTLGRRFPYVGS